MTMPSRRSNSRERSKPKKSNTSEVDEERSKQSSDSSSDDEDSSGSEGESEESVCVKGKSPLFTDENAKWLKPKGEGTTKQLLSSDDETGESDDEDEEKEELLEIEKEAILVDEEVEAERQEAEAEMRRTVRDQTAIYHLPTEEELQKDVDRVVPPSEIRSHIESILEVLAQFKTRREEGRARKEYIDKLGSFVAELYGYLPELVEYFISMLGPAEALEFIDASDKPRPLVIRTNTLKTRRKDLAAALMKRGVLLDPLASWSKVGLKIMESPVPIGATPEYLGGMYMLQSAASMCPVLALSPEPKERVLDMSAAPGGKTSYISQLMRNTGVIFANDLRPERQKSTVANMHRLGVKNVITCAHDGRKMGVMFKNRFDRILLDAPCSGLGVISRDPSVKVQRTMADVLQCAHLQKELLIAAIDALKCKGTTGGGCGVLVYSTCSVSVAENEEVVSYALAKRDIRIIDTGLDFGKQGFTRFQHRRFHPSLSLTRRFYPHIHNMDGFYVAKIEKLSDRRPEDTLVEEEKGDIEEETTATTNAEKKNALKVADDEKKHQQKTHKREASKRSNVSVPPPRSSQGKKKKQKTNAKVTKPRRIKVNIV